MTRAECAVRPDAILEASKQMNGTATPKYVIITPAKNEQASIEKTIESVISQTVRPVKWVIVDDGSADHTAEIVSSYLPSYAFMHLLKMRTSGDRHFGKKVAAFNAGLELLKTVQYSFVGNLDADISFGPDYYARVVAEFERVPRLGIAGGMVHTRIGRSFITTDTTSDSVGGCVQLFRKECFEQIGGYMVLPNGGVDAAAEIMARMHGWSVRKVPHNDVYEHRRTGSAQNGVVAAAYKEGLKFHSLGYGTVFYLFRCVYRLMDKPLLIGSILSLIGFVSAKLHGYPVDLPSEAVSYLRGEQMGKLKQALLRRGQEVAPVF